MKILHCIPALSGGGAERQLKYIASEQARLGHEVSIAYVQCGPAGASAIDDPSVRCLRLSSWGNRDPRLPLQLASIVRRRRPDVLQTWIVQMDVLGGAVARSLSIPWVLREPCSEEAWPTSMKHRVRLWLGSYANAIVSNSLGGDEYWAKHAAHTMRYIIPNGVPLAEIGSTQSASMAELSLPDDVPLVLYAGRLFDVQKNVKNMVRAFALLAKQSKAILVLCGEGPDRPALEQMASEASVAHRVRFLGHVKNVWRWMKRADVFLFPSHYEGQPNAVIEAIACEAPLVLSGIRPHRDLVSNGGAVFVDPRDPQDISRGVLACLNDAQAARHRSSLARRTLDERSFGLLAKRYCDIYEKVICAAKNPVTS